MPVAVISDIHANRHALDAVLADVDDHECDEVWCLGDVVGFGADPNGCCATIRRFASVCLAGNHELLVSGTLAPEGLTDDAVTAVAWTAKELSAEHRGWLATLRPTGVAHGYRLAHASPADPAAARLLTAEQATPALAAFDEQVALIGHSHVALAFSQDGKQPVVRRARGDGDEARIGARRWLLNPGSVGQPRDHDPRAAWMQLDPDEGHVVWRRVPYDVDGAARAIREAGLPVALADRLQHGR